MDLKRLKFAAARGADIQLDTPRDPYSRMWVLVNPGHLYSFSHLKYRLHPNHEAMEYGPMSTALLELAQHPKDWSGQGSWLTPMQWAAREYAIVLAEDLDSGNERAVLFEDGGWELWCGIVAEYLADQGM